MDPPQNNTSLLKVYFMTVYELCTLNSLGEGAKVQGKYQIYTALLLTEASKKVFRIHQHYLHIILNMYQRRTKQTWCSKMNPKIETKQGIDRMPKSKNVLLLLCYVVYRPRPLHLPLR